MKNNYPTEIEEDGPEILRKLAELHAHQDQLIRKARREVRFWMTAVIVLSVYVGWVLRALFFA